MKKKINGTKLHFIEKGDKEGLPFVFIHGFPFDLTMWDNQIGVMPPRFRTIAIDLRGFGDSQVGDGQYCMEYFVDDVFALLDELELPEAILCGFSMGGYVALRGIEKNPGRVRGLVLADTRAEADSNQAKLNRAKSLTTVKEEGMSVFADTFLKSVCREDTLNHNSALIEKLRKGISMLSPLAAGGALLAMAGRTDTTNYLEKISVPTLILVGEHDALTPPIVSQAMHEKIPNSQMHVIPNAAHISPVENPEDFNRHLLKYLSGFRL